jgi:hypothetical protein
MSLAPDLTTAVAQAGVDLTFDARALQDAFLRAIAPRRGSCNWTIDHANWVVTLYSPEARTVSDRTLEEALAWRLVRLMVPELGIGPFVV